MCGIAGLFLKDAKLEPDLGSMLAMMLSPLTDRGPDSAGFAVYGAETPGHVKFTLRLPPTFDVDRLLKRLQDELGAPVSHRLHGTHIVVAIPAERTALAHRANGPIQRARDAVELRRVRVGDDGDAHRMSSSNSRLRNGLRDSRTTAVVVHRQSAEYVVTIRCAIQ